MRGSPELIAEVVPGVAPAICQPVPASADRPTSIGPGLRRKQESDPGADGQAKDHARREHDAAARLAPVSRNAGGIGTGDGDWAYRPWLGAGLAPPGGNGAGV
jgi:hypothetical protein